MFAATLRSIMVSYDEMNGILQPDQLDKLGNSIVEQDASALTLDVFTVTFTDHGDIKAHDTFQRLLVLQDVRLQVDRPYLYWCFAGHQKNSEKAAIRVNWSTIALLLCLARAHVVDVVTFAVGLMELYVLESVETVRRVVKTPIGTAKSFLSSCAHAPVLMTVLLEVATQYPTLFGSSLEVLESLHTDACVYAVHQRSMGSDYAQDGNMFTRIDLPRHITAIDIVKLLLLHRNMNELSGSVPFTWTIDTVEDAVKRINSAISMRLQRTSALVELLTVCAAKNAPAQLFQNNGRRLRRIGAQLCPALSAQKNVEAISITDVSKAVLTTIAEQKTCIQCSQAMSMMLERTYKQLQIVHTVNIYCDGAVDDCFGQFCVELLQSHKSNLRALQNHMFACIDSCTPPASSLAKVTHSLTICTYAFRALHETSTISTFKMRKTHESICSSIEFKFRTGKLLLKALQDVDPSRPSELLSLSTLQQIATLYINLFEYLWKVLQAYDASSDLAHDDIGPMLRDAQLLQAIFAAVQTFYLLHVVTSSATGANGTNCLNLSLDDDSSIATKDSMEQAVLLTVQILLHLFSLHFHLYNAGDAISNQDMEVLALKNILFAQCFAFLFSLTYIIAAKNDIAEEPSSFMVISSEQRELLGRCEPKTRHAMETLVNSLYPCAATLIIDRCAASDSFFSNYCKALITLCTGSAAIQSKCKCIHLLADNVHTVASLSLSVSFERKAAALIFFKFCFVDCCGETYRDVVTLAKEHCINEFEQCVEAVTRMTMYSYVPSLVISFYLPLVQQVPVESLEFLAIAKETPVLALFPHMPIPIFTMVTGALAILCSVCNKVHSVIGQDTDVSRIDLSLEPATLHDSLAIVALFLIVMHSEPERLVAVTSIKKLDALISSLEVTEKLESLPICAGINLTKLFREGVDFSNNMQYLEGLLSVVYILMTAMYPFTETELTNLRAFQHYTADQWKKATTSGSIKVATSLSSYSSEVFRTLAMESMWPFLSIICIREVHLGKSQQIPNVYTLWSKLKAIYLSVLIYGIDSPAVLELLLDYFGVVFYTISTHAPDFLYLGLAGTLFMNMEALLAKLGIDPSVFQIFWLGYVRMMLNTNAGAVNQLTLQLLDGWNMPEETKEIARLLVSLYRSPAEFRATQLYSSASANLDTATDTTAVSALLGILEAATTVSCELLWHILLPLIIHTLSDLFARMYIPLLLSLTHSSFNFFATSKPALAESKAATIVRLVLYIREKQDKIENKRLQALTQYVIINYERVLGNIMSWHVLTPKIVEPKHKVVQHSMRKSTKSRKKQPDSYFDELVHYTINRADLYAATFATEITDYLGSLDTPQRAKYISHSTHQHMKVFVEQLHITLKDAERAVLLYDAPVVTNLSSFYVTLMRLMLSILMEGLPQKYPSTKPGVLQCMEGFAVLWTIIAPYVAVMPALGPLYYDALLMFCECDEDLHEFADSTCTFLVYLFAMLITQQSQLIESIESHLVSSIYVSSTDMLYGARNGSETRPGEGGSDIIQSLESRGASMREALVEDIADLKRLVTGKGILTEAAFHPCRLSPSTLEQLQAVSLGDSVTELRAICSFLIQVHFSKHFGKDVEDKERFLFKYTLPAELAPKEARNVLYLSRLDTDFMDSATLTRTMPKGAQKNNTDYLSLLRTYSELNGNPLRLILVASVYWASQTADHISIFREILEYISTSYAAIFSLYFLKVFKPEVFFSIMLLISEGNLGGSVLNTDPAERRATAMSASASIIAKLIAGAADQKKIVYNQDISDTSSNSQLLDRFYGVGYALLGSLYALASGYPTDDAFSIPQWTLSQRRASSTNDNTHGRMIAGLSDMQKSLYDSGVAMGLFFRKYNSLVCEVKHWRDLTTFLREQEFFEQMMIALDQLPAETHIYVMSQLYRQRATLLHHNCQFLYLRIVELACVRYRECRYTDLTIRLLVHEFIDNTLFDFSNETQMFIVESLFGELVMDIDCVENQEFIVVSTGTRCSVIAGMYTALSTYSFLISVIHHLLFRVSPIDGCQSQIDCWSKTYQRLLVTAMSAWMLVVCALMKLMAQYGQKLMEESFDGISGSSSLGNSSSSNNPNSTASKTSMSFILNSVLYFAPGIDFCLYLGKHQVVARSIINLIEEARTPLHDTPASTKGKEIQGLGNHILTFLIALSLDTLILETNEKLNDILNGFPALFLQNQFANMCSIVHRLCETKTNLIAIEYTTMPAKQIEGHILCVIIKKLIPYPAHFDISIRQFGVHMLKDRGLDDSGFRHSVFATLIKRIFSVLEVHPIYGFAYLRYKSFSTNTTSVFRYLQQEYTKKTVNITKQSLAQYIEADSFLLIPTLEAISSLREFEYGIAADKYCPHKIDSITECNSVFEHYYKYYSTRHAANFVVMLRHFSSKRAPLLFRFLRSKDDEGTKMILKCGEDTVADYSVMQFVDELRQRGTGNFFKPYFVAVVVNIPKNQVSVIEHIDGDVVPLDEVLSPVLMGAKVKAIEFTNEQEPDNTGCFPAFDLFMTSVAALSHIQMTLAGTHPCLFITSSQERQARFATTLANWCAICIVTGLGDRHSCNILVDKATGDVHFIDFEAVFEYPKLLSYAELVPFRLTTLLAQILGPSGIHGRFYWQLVSMVAQIQDNIASFINTFYPLAIVRNSFVYIRRIKAMLENQTAEEIVNMTLSQAADSSRLGSMFGGWMAFL